MSIRSAEALRINKVNSFCGTLNFYKQQQNLCSSTYRACPEKIEFFYIDEKSQPEIKGYIIINDLSYSAYISNMQVQFKIY